MKTLHEYIVDTDVEYDIEVVSTMDIHNDQQLKAISGVLARYDLRKFDVGTVSIMQDDPPEFPGATMVNVYKISAKIGIMPDWGTRGISHELSFATVIPQQLIYASVPGEEYNHNPDLYHYGPDTDFNKEEKKVNPGIIGLALGEPENEKGLTDFQDLVGMNAVERAVAETDKEWKARQKKTKEKIDVIALSHLGIKEFFNESVEKGYYKTTISKDRDGNVKLVEKEGPFKTPVDTQSRLVFRREEL